MYLKVMDEHLDRDPRVGRKLADKLRSQRFRHVRSRQYQIPIGAWHDGELSLSEELSPASDICSMTPEVLGLCHSISCWASSARQGGLALRVSPIVLNLAPLAYTDLRIGSAPELLSTGLHRNIGLS
jgi:hypothetical protein